MAHGENENWYFIFLLMQNFIGLYETLNALLTVRSEMFPFLGNNQNIKCSESPRTLRHIGYVDNNNLPLGNIALQ